MLSRVVFFLFFLFSLPALAQPDDALGYCREKIRLENETFRVKLEKYQQALDRYLTFVKKREDRDWAGYSPERKQRFLDEIVLFQKPIDELKKTEFTREEDCLAETDSNLWATRTLVLNSALENRGYLPRQQVESAWFRPEIAKLRQLVKRAEREVKQSCILVTYDRPDSYASCVTRLAVSFSMTSEGNALEKQIDRETLLVFKNEIVSERDAPACQLSVSCYLDK